MTPLIAAVVTPRLAAIGWRFTCFTYAAVAAATTVVWALCASNSPRDLARAPSHPPTTAAGKKPAAAPKSVEWGIFRLASVRAMVVYWVAFGNINYTLSNLAPTFFMQKLNCTPLQVRSEDLNQEDVSVSLSLSL